MKDFNRVFLIAFVIMFAIGFGCEPCAADSRPNIVLIFADDLGWKDVGFQGSDFMETPNLDRLATEGMVFPSAYAAAGNCAPSRACLLSGTYTPRHHVYAVGSTDRGPKLQQRLVPIPNKSGLSVDNVTLADALKSAGYATGHFGKWHLGGKDGAKPKQQGFDVSVETSGESQESEVAETKKNGPNADPKGAFSLTQKACEFIEANQKSPFFCYLAHHAIHSPLQARPETLAKFKAKKPGSQHSNPLYAACAYDLDESVGILMAKLKQLGLDHNTLLVFTSDNGGTQQSSQEPLRGNKGCYYEGGIREPFIVRWPGVTKPGSVCKEPVINIDLFPTFLAAANAKVPEGKTLDGESLLPLLKSDGTLNRKSIFWHFPGYLDAPVIRGRELDVRTGFRSRPVSIIHKGHWKLHMYHEEWQLDGGREKMETNQAIELYDLATDIGERDNLVSKNPIKRDELLNDLIAWQKSTNALVPTEVNSQYDPTAASKKQRKEEQEQVLALSKLTVAPEMVAAEGFADDGELKAIFYDALPWQGKPTKVFAWLGIPENRTGKVPAVVLLHGGGGTAFKEWVRKWNERGYAAISIAVEGQTDAVDAAFKGPDNPAGWKRHAWPGPNRKGIYADSGVSLKDQWMYHAVADTVLANSLMRSLHEVDSSHVGLMGISWGGVIASTVIGIDERFAFAIPTYGCGHLYDSDNQYGRALGQNSLYREVWDPMVRMQRAKMPTLWFSWPEETHFPLDSHAANYSAALGPHMVSLIPRMGHGHEPPWNLPDSYAFADSVVRDGKPWCLQSKLKHINGVVECEFMATKPLDAGVLVTTTDTGFTGSRKWIETPTTLTKQGDTWLVTGTLPAGTTAWFANVRSGNLTASSDYQQVP
jgi:arylsulfatase A-like enzyme/dienelactone hydrolase